MATAMKEDLGNACSGLDKEDLDELRAIARLCIDSKGIIITIANWAAEAGESLMGHLPKDWTAKVNKVSEMALKQANEIAFSSHADEDSQAWTNKVLSWAKGERWHQVATGVTGALGGLGGWPTLVAELPTTTTMILRSIQEIAAAHGEDIQDPEVRKQCIAVFGLGGPVKEDDEVEVGFIASRVAMQGKAIAAVINRVLPQFSAMVGEKLLSQAAPVLGAAAGMTVNPAFMKYYQNMSHAHFRMRKVERKYDPEHAKACLERIFKSEKAKSR